MKSNPLISISEMIDMKKGIGPGLRCYARSNTL